MAKYVGLFNWTDQGVRNAQDTVQRVEQARSAFGAMGIQIETIYWTLGRYDIVAVFDAPDDETVTAAMLRLSGQGNVRSETLRAFTAEDVSGILSKLG